RAHAESARGFLQNPASDPFRMEPAARLPGAGEHRGELLAAIARREIHRPGLLAKDSGKEDKRVVSFSVAERVVVLLEVVEVEKDEAEGASTGGGGELPFQEEVELASVRELHQRIGQR